MTFRSENFLELLVPSQPVNFGLGEGGGKVCGLRIPYWGKGGGVKVSVESQNFYPIFFKSYLGPTNVPY